jgi:hypothetical protein
MKRLANRTSTMDTSTINMKETRDLSVSYLRIRRRECQLTCLSATSTIICAVSSASTLLAYLALERSVPCSSQNVSASAAPPVLKAVVNSLAG